MIESLREIIKYAQKYIIFLLIYIVNKGRIGIDLGTTFCCCGMFKNRRVDIVTYNDSKTTFPSHVYYDPKTPEIVAGSSARFTVKSIGHAVFDSKRFIGRAYDDPFFQDDMKNWPFKVIRGQNDIPMVEIEYNNGIARLTANDISKEILKAIKKQADELIGNDVNLVTEAVITVPAYFNQKQREYTAKAAEAANLKVIQIINEPTAAAIGYAHQRLQENEGMSGIRKLLIYDFGGGAFDVSIIKLDYGRKTVTVLGTGGDSHLGGNDIDQNLVNFYVDKYCQAECKSRDSIPSKKIIKLRKACEEAKCLLSADGCDEADIGCDWLEDHVDTKINTSILDELNRDLYDRTMEIVDEVLDDANLSQSDITDVVLVGGSSRIKAIQKKISNRFRLMCRNVNCDEIVAYGATIAANMSEFNFTVSDVISHSLSTDLDNSTIYEMLHKNTEIPCKRTQQFANYQDDQQYVDVTVFEGDGDKIPGKTEEKRINKNVAKIGYFKFDLPRPNKAREVFITITFDVNESGILKVTAEAESGGRVRSLDISLSH